MDKIFNFKEMMSSLKKEDTESLTEAVTGNIIKDLSSYIKKLNESLKMFQKGGDIKVALGNIAKVDKDLSELVKKLRKISNF